MKKVFIILVSLFALMAASTGLKAQEVTILLRPGWNWIGYPYAEPIELENAFEYSGSFVRVRVHVCVHECVCVCMRVHVLPELGLHCFARAFSNCSKQACVGFSLRWLILWSTVCGQVGFSSGARA